MTEVVGGCQKNSVFINCKMSYGQKNAFFIKKC